MALQFILGGSGSGKSEWLYDRLLRCAEQEKQSRLPGRSEQEKQSGLPGRSEQEKQSRLPGRSEQKKQSGLPGREEQKKQKMIYLIVPEQFTLQAQKGIVARQKNGAIMNIDVVSFNRLAYRVFDELGMDDLVVLEDTGKSLILRRLAEEHKNELRALKNQIHRMGYIDQIKSLISEFMQYGFTSGQLRAYLESLPGESAFYYKMSDVLLLYEAFEEYLKGSYVTAEQLLSVLAKHVPESALLKGSVLAFDGFTGFTPVQMELLKPLLSVCSQAYVTVTADAIAGAEGSPTGAALAGAEGLPAPGVSAAKCNPSAAVSLDQIAADRGMQELFFMSRKMIRTVTRAAKESGCAVEDAIILPGEITAAAGRKRSDENLSVRGTGFSEQPEAVKTRFSENPPLQFLERNLFRTDAARAVYKGTASAPEVISISALATPKEELIFAAAKIRELARCGAYRYSEIAIISGNEALYEKYAADILGSFGIPFFSDNKESIYFHPFTEWVRALLEIVQKDFSYESVFRYLRTGLCGFSAEEIDRLDNYCVDRGIAHSKKWKEKWVRPARTTGRGIRKSEGDQSGELLKLNELRERFLAQIMPLYAAAKAPEATVKDLTQAIYDTMAALKIQEQLKIKQEYYEGLAGSGPADFNMGYHAPGPGRAGEALSKIGPGTDPARAENKAAACAQIYRIVIDLLDKVVDLLGEEKIPLKEYVQILDAGFLSARVGVVPPGADCVTLGDIERTRLDGIKVLFFLGVNDGVIPKAEERKTLLSDFERERMRESEIELAPTAREQVFLQRFYLYLNLTKPSKMLYLTYSRMGTDGKGQNPSYLIRTITRMFPALGVEEYAAGTAAVSMTAQSSRQEFLRGLAAARGGKVEEKWMDLAAWRLKNPQFKEETETLFEAAFASYESGRLNTALAKDLFGTVLSQSVTRLEQFARCAYAHFLTYGLKLGERPEYAFEASDLGTIFHDALASYSRRMQEQSLDWFTITEEEQQRVLGEAIEETLLSMDTSVLTDTARSRAMIERIEAILADSVRALTRQVRKGDFVPTGYEVPFYIEVPIPAQQENTGKSKTGSGSSEETGPGVETGIASGSSEETGSGIGAESGPGVETEIASGSSVESGSGIEVETETDPGSENKAGSEPAGETSVPDGDTGETSALGKMLLTGRIDRIDLFEEDGTVYVKILDYKSGKNIFRLQNLYDGLQLQLITYILGSEAYLKRHCPGQKAVPAGVLYFHLDRPVVEAEPGTAPEQAEQKIFEELRPEGLINSDGAVIDHLDKTIRTKTGKSDVIPVSLGKDGTLRSQGNSAVSTQQFEWLTDYVITKMQEEGAAILSGEIAAHPVQTKDTDGCKYCPYHGICGFDARIPGCRPRRTARYPDPQLWEKIQSSGSEPEKAADVRPEKTADARPEKTAGVKPEKAADVRPEKAAGMKPVKE